MRLRPRRSLRRASIHALPLRQPPSAERRSYGGGMRALPAHHSAQSARRLDGQAWLTAAQPSYTPTRSRIRNFPDKCNGTMHSHKVARHLCAKVLTVDDGRDARRAKLRRWRHTRRVLWLVEEWERDTAALARGMHNSVQRRLIGSVAPYAAGSQHRSKVPVEALKLTAACRPGCRLSRRARVAHPPTLPVRCAPAARTRARPAALSGGQRCDKLRRLACVITPNVSSP